MRSMTRVGLFGALIAALAVQLPAQRGLAPSSSAIGAGALNTHPSSTARSTAPARVSIYTPGYGGLGYRNGVYGSSGAYGYGRDTRRMPFAYWIAPYYYPPFGYGDTGLGAAPSPYDSPEDDPGLAAAIAAQNALVDQVRKLNTQVAQLQYGQQLQSGGIQDQQAPPEAPVTLVLRDGQQLQVQSYAVMGQTFWDFSRQPVRKIPLAAIDVAASQKATEAKGGEFPQISNP